MGTVLVLLFLWDADHFNYLSQVSTQLGLSVHQFFRMTIVECLLYEIKTIMLDNYSLQLFPVNC